MACGARIGLGFSAFGFGYPLIQLRLLKRQFFLHWVIYLGSLVKISCRYTLGLFGNSSLLFWSVMYLSLWHYTRLCLLVYKNTWNPVAWVIQLRSSFSDFFFIFTLPSLLLHINFWIGLSTSTQKANWNFYWEYIIYKWVWGELSS